MSRPGLAPGALLLVAILVLQSAWIAPPAALAVPAAESEPAGDQAGPPAEPRQPGEQPDLRTATSRTVVNDDGTFTTSLFTAPVHYLDGAGAWLEIDSALVDSDRSGYRWRNKANAFGLHLKEELADDYLRFEVAGQAFTLSLEGGNRGVGRANGARAAYESVLPGVDLEYEVLPDGVKETLVLADADAPTTYRFLLNVPADVALEAIENSDGSASFFMAPYAEPLFVFAAPRAVESAGENEVAAEAQSNASMAVRPRGRDFSIEVTLDADWLAAEGRRFPVLLDPTITIQPTVEDASFPATCAGCGPFISDRVYLGTDQSNAWRGALQFDLGDVPTGVTLTSAVLGLRFDGYCIAAGGAQCGGTSHQIDVHRMTASWSTSSRTSDLQFEAAALASDTLAAGSGTRWMSWTITPTVQSWINGTQPNYGLLAKRNTEPLGVSGPVPPGRRYTGEPTIRPKLDVTYTSDAIELLVPDTLHSNGADLRWTRFAPPSGAPFERYEVHRSSSSTFAPDASTLIATIADVEVTAYRDTTARPAATFTYKVLANTSPSVGRTVTLPADGLATKLLQPDPVTGQATYLYHTTTLTNCANYGADQTMWVGTTSTNTYRSVLAFDVRDIPAGATVTSATLSLWRPYIDQPATTVNVHRVTRDWQEGTGLTQCTGDGATWYETQGGQPWTAQGGDFDPAAVASRAVAVNEAPQWHDFGVASAVQTWVDGSASNLGFLLKYATETLAAGNAFRYYSDDFTGVPTQRPKLAVTYEDGSHAQGPHVSISSPGAGTQVGGNAVTITADASDDRRVDLVEFRLDGNLLASDTAAPYSVTWNSTATSNGSHTLSVRATDDAGNVTTSAGTTISVDNSTPPTTSVTAPANNATVSGAAVTVSANASDDVGVTRVEFYVDDIRIGEDATAPYSVSWNTLNPDLPFYDGAHVVTSRAYDGGGKVTASAAVNVTANNRGTTLYKATFALAGGAIVPSTMAYDPGAGQQTNAGLNLTITNNSTSTWSSSSIFLRYRWFGPGHSAATPNVVVSANISLGQNVQKNKSVTLNGVIITPPALPDGLERGQYRLVLDLFNASANKYFAEQGNRPLDNPIIVNKILRTKLGLERFHQYYGTDAGAAMGHLVNVANGNSLLRWTPFLTPGRGLSTVVDLTYNSLEDRSDSPLGNNWSASISGLARLGSRLDVHPHNADTIAGNANRWIAFIDGDGTAHRFDGRLVGSTVVWDSPPGVHLYLREYSTTDATRKWALTRPDRVTFFYDTEGYPTSVVDKNGNELRFTLSTVAPGDDPGGASKRVTKVTDAAGVADSATQRSFDITYYTKAEAKKPQVRGRIRTLTDHTGSELAFEYYDDGNLRRTIQRGGTNADGTPLADRVLVFTYTTPSGDGPAIPVAADRVNPDPKTNQSSRVYSVRDPKGAETLFSYFGPTSGQLRWKLSGVTDRSGQTTAFAYDLVQRITTVTAPLTRVTRYAYDTDGKVTSITDPANRVTNVTWTSDFHVASVDEPGDGLTEFAYSDNGYLTDRKVKIGVDGSSNPIWSHTLLAYENVAADVKDIAVNWQTGRDIPHLSQLANRTDPNGMATATPTDDYQWSFNYDPEGNLVTVTDPAAFDTSYAYYANGNLQTATDANTHATTFNTYDPSGQPTKITDAAGGVTQFGYDPDGLLLWVQDANHASSTGGDPRGYRSYLDYDAFHRLGRQSTPKSTALEAGTLIWSAAAFDANDNVLREIGPHFGAGYTGTGALTTHAFDAMDRETLMTGPDNSVDTAGERVALAYDAAGRLTSQTLPKGVATTGSANDFASFYTYDALDRVLRQTRHLTDAAGAITSSLHTHACYDLAGDLVQLTTPRANLATVNCAAPVEANSTTFEYDDAHRRTAVIDPLAHRSETAYDRSSNVTSATDAAGSATAVTYDERNLPTRIVAPFTTGTGGRPITTVIEYDPVGNRSRLISPRAFDVANGGPTFTHYVTRYAYDALNRLARVDLPTDTAYPTQHYVHNAYDGVGNLAWNSLPVTTASAGAVPAGSKTEMTYWDPSWIASSDTPDTTPRVHFDFSAEGWQRLRTPEAPGGGLNLGEQQISTYFVDGSLRERKDRGGQLTSYAYDANNNLLTALDAAGVTAADRSPMDVQATWDSLDRLAKVRSKEQTAANYRFTTYAYDLNANVTRRDDDGLETPAGALVTAARRNDYTYDAADWLGTQLDYGTSSGSTDDQRITNTFFPTGWEQNRVVARNNGSGTWVTKQTTDWTHYLNGQLKTLVTKNGAGTTLESHTVDYVDTAGDYVNGHRTKDVFTQQGPDTTAPCRSAACTATYAYDPRDKLLREVNGHGATTDYTLDAAGNITRELVSGDGAKDVTYAYTGSQLTSVTAGGVTQRQWYDPNGNLDCVTLSTGSQANCAAGSGGTYSPQVLADYSYDYLDRMTQVRSFVTNGSTSTKDDASDYEYDALDRVLEQTESHGATGSPRTTLMSYLGMGTQVSRETQHNGVDGTAPLLTTKSYSYDAYGHRIGLTDSPSGGSAASYTYGYDVHGSVSLLLGDTGTASASYGYRAYGAADAELTKGDLNADNPLNAYRYSAKRLDSGSGSIDMGARRFGPDTARFLQRDVFNGATADLGLALDPLTQNRYALAGGNPISFMEWDGHLALLNGGGGGGSTPTSTATTASTAAPSTDNSGFDFGDVGGFFVGVGEGAWALGEGAVDIGSWAVRSATDEGQRALNRQVVGYVWDNPGEAAGAVWSGVTDPIAQDWQSGNQGEAIGRAVFDIGTAVAPLTKLATAGRVGTSARGAAGGLDDVARAAPSAAYSRPSGATTAAQRAAVQGRPCAVCGQIAPRQIADHINPLVVEHYTTGGINLQRMRSVSSVQPMCPKCSAIEGGNLRWYSEFMRDFYGFD